MRLPPLKLLLLLLLHLHLMRLNLLHRRLWVGLSESDASLEPLLVV